MGFGLLAKLFPPQPRAITAGVVVDDDDVNESDYLDLASKAGFGNANRVLKARSAEREIAKFRAFLNENNIPVFLESSVVRYMGSVTPPGRDWTWVSAGEYDRPIPYPVLRTMARIRETYPEARFEISEITKVPKPDPFLRVGIQPLQPGPYEPRTRAYPDEWFIIERWDEPAFRVDQ